MTKCFTSKNFEVWNRILTNGLKAFCMTILCTNFKTGENIFNQSENQENMNLLMF